MSDTEKSPSAYAGCTVILTMKRNWVENWIPARTETEKKMKTVGFFKRN